MKFDEFVRFEDKYWILFGLLVIFLLLSPYIINWDNSYITIHDNLDGIFVLPRILDNQHVIWDFDSTVAFMEGIKRISCPMTLPWEILPLINYLFPGYGGYLVNYFLVVFIAFVGMWLLLVHYVTNNKYLAFGVSIIYCMIPFYIEFGISSAGIPMLLFALINIRNYNRLILNYAIVVFYAFYSSLALSGLFVCLVLFVWNISLWYEEKKPNKNLFLALILLTGIYLTTNWAIIQDFFMGSDFVSHRVEWSNNLSIISIFYGLLFNSLLISQYHAGVFYAYPIIIIYILVYLWYRSNDKSLSYYLIAYLILSLLIIIGAIARLIPMGLFKSFQFDRFYFFYPAVCFVMFAKACDVLYKKKKCALLVCSILISIACVGLTHKEYQLNLLKMAGHKINTPSFAQFYDESLFNAIANGANIPKDNSVKIVSVGLYPAIASYNGFWSLDGYMSSYPLEYKHKFRQVISDELEKSSALKHYFDDWGNRCYLFSAELGNKYLYGKAENEVVEHLEINTKALKELECQYIFSAVEIKNYEDLNLSMVGDYTTPESFWRIRVYKL